MRLLMGVLAGQREGFSATLTGDPSLSHRPMKRVTEPLRKMNASIEGKDNGNFKAGRFTKGAIAERIKLSGWLAYARAVLKDIE